MEIDEILLTKKTYLTSNAIFALIWRVAIDCYIFGNLEKILSFVFDEIKNDKIDLNKDEDFESDLLQVLEKIADFVFKEKLDNHSYEKYNWRKMKLNKEYILKKFNYFLTYGSKAWIEDMPKGYYMHKHKIPENSVLLHARNRGVIEIGPKICFSPKKFKNLFKWEELDRISEKIIDRPDLVFEYTCKNNYGSIITNGTAILGLGDIGALAGMPVMEGKSVLFKYFGGTNICPVCIQEKNVDKVISYVQE